MRLLIPAAIWYELCWLNGGPQIARFMGPTWGPPGSCRSQIGTMLAPWTLLSAPLSLPVGWSLLVGWRTTANHKRGHPVGQPPPGTGSRDHLRPLMASKSSHVQESLSRWDEELHAKHMTGSCKYYMLNTGDDHFRACISDDGFFIIKY